MGILKIIIGKNEYKDTSTLPVEMFLRTLHTAAKCRYIASSRLKNKGYFSFTTTTALSLGLIFIPLMQSADLSLSFPDKVLNMIEIFLAVSILVYSIINSKAGYEVRAEKINECGDKIKELARKLESELSACSDKSQLDYEDYRNRYVDIDTDVENHTQLDYAFARMSMPSFYNVSGIKKFFLWMKSHIKIFLSFYVSILILSFEAIIILDMLNIVNLLSPYFVALSKNS